MSDQKITCKKAIDKFAIEALAIEAETAKKRDALGFMCRALTIATMPHKKTNAHYFMRSNGNFTMLMMAHPKYGLPYGTIPRLLTGWITTEAVRTESAEIALGDSLSQFMAKLDMMPTGGRWGTIPRIKKQTLSLFTCNVRADYDNSGKNKTDELPTGAFGKSYQFAEKYQLWWEVPKGQTSLWESKVVLGQTFFEEVMNHKIPIDWDAVKALKQSPMALDIYFWLTHRNSYLSKITHIPWELLQLQFGAEYPNTSQGKSDFKRKFLMRLKKVLQIYKDARVEDGKKSGLILIPSPTHIPMIQGS